jgi:hypothetical protein
LALDPDSSTASTRDRDSPEGTFMSRVSNMISVAGLHIVHLQQEGPLDVDVRYLR